MKIQQVWYECSVAGNPALQTRVLKCVSEFARRWSIALITAAVVYPPAFAAELRQSSVKSNVLAPKNEHPFLGVDAEDYSEDGVQGARVRIATRPASEAGIRRSDVIVRVNKITVRNKADLVAAIRRFQPGERVEVAVMRKPYVPAEYRVSVVLSHHPVE